MNTIRKHSGPLTDEYKNDLARAFVDSVTEVLVAKSLRALKYYGYKSLVVAGGFKISLRQKRR